MYNPIPHLPDILQKFIHWLKARRIHPKIIFFVLGILSTAWFLIRVVPKPSRANYPCMQATAPFMSAFILYLLSLGGAVMAFKRFLGSLARSRPVKAALFIVIALGLYVISLTLMDSPLFARRAGTCRGDFPPNEPMGTAKGIFPGRVVWMWDSGATNENCTNTSNNDGVIDDGDDAWFMEKNNDMAVIDSMLIKSLLSLTGASDNVQAWDLIFRYYNINHGHGDVGYSTGEKIMVKINATSAYGGVADGRFHSDLSRTDDQSVNRFAAETDPYVVLALLRQLVYVAGIPQDLIYIGDPARNIYKESYDLWHAEFPEVNCLGNNLIHPELEIEKLGRLPVEHTASDLFFFSDHGAVMPDALSDKLFTVYEDADYLINVPALKAHAAAGITLAAKNHFGSFPRTWALHLHAGLMGGGDDPQRTEYGLYRIQTDIMMHNLLSGKNLLIIVDGLYPGDEALAVPGKWTSTPFDGDWCSSIFISLDPVAVESVCHDFLRSEYNGPTIATSRPNWAGVDDYLHQAADSSNWPEGIVYDPDDDGILIASLGVHEHWNDASHKEYTRNLHTGEGIEFVKAHEANTGIDPVEGDMGILVFPNPCRDWVHLSCRLPVTIHYLILDQAGREVISGVSSNSLQAAIDTHKLPAGCYIMILNGEDGCLKVNLVKQ